MKKKLTHCIKSVFLGLILLVAFSCQVEELNTEDELLLSISSAKAKAKTTSLEFQECNVILQTTDLYAGQHMLVGNVTVEESGDNYLITYNLTNDEYCLTETHLSVVESPEDFPHKNGNPQNGHFEFKMEHDCISSYTYEVPKSNGNYIAAHAVVNCKPTDDLETFYESLPATTNFCLRTGREIENARSYFRATIAEGILAGSHWAWCMDLNKSIDSSGEDKCYEGFNVYSLSDDLSGIVSMPDNLDNALWLLNNLDGLLDGGTYLYGNIQWTFWKLLNNQECNSCNANLNLPAGEDAKIKGMELYNLAMAEGEGYTPECGEDTMVIIDNGVLQPLFVPFEIPCDQGECEETAWGDGCDFPGNNWATYFEYGIGG